MAAAPDLARLRTTLASSGAAPDGVAVDASVMVCLREGPSGAEVLLCRRAQRPGDPWSGHIALPGGRVEPGDRDSLATAARETREEVGFDPLAHGVLLGALEPLVPRSLPIAVAAHVVVVERPVELVLSDELAAAWWTPFAELRPTRAEVAEVPAPVSAWRLPHEDADDVVLWGITYRILRRLLDAAR